MIYNDLKRNLINGILFSPESIRRVRQKVQELYPETRGIMYFKRHKMTNEMKLILKQYENTDNNNQLKLDYDTN
jgi:hypothetical protein